MLRKPVEKLSDWDDVCSTELVKSLHGKQNKAPLAGLNTSHLLKLISPFGCLNFHLGPIAFRDAIGPKWNHLVLKL